MAGFKTYKSFHNYLLSGKKVKCDKLVYKYTNGMLWVYKPINSSWARSVHPLQEFVYSWSLDHIEKVRNNNHLNQLTTNSEVW